MTTIYSYFTIHVLNPFVLQLYVCVCVCVCTVEGEHKVLWVDSHNYEIKDSFFCEILNDMGAFLNLWFIKMYTLC